MVPEPVDAPIDRTDLENLVDPDSSDADSAMLFPFDAASFGELADVITVNLYSDTDAVAEVATTENPPEAPIEESQQHRFGKSTQEAMLGSSLLICQLSMRGQQLKDQAASISADDSNIFSRTARLVRKALRNHPTHQTDLN